MEDKIEKSYRFSKNFYDDALKTNGGAACISNWFGEVLTTTKLPARF